MPTETRSEAVDKLTREAQKMGLDDLRDFHNELFPEEPIPGLDSKDLAPVRRKVLDYLAHGVEVEEILDLWNVVFPEAWNVYYDDETDTIHFLSEPEAIRQGD